MRSPISTAPERRWLQKLVTAVATLTGNLFLVVGSLFFATIAFLVAWIPPRGDWTFRVARLWGWGALLASGVRIDIQFAAGLDPNQQYVFMANHRSLFDIPSMLVSLPGQARFLAKKSLFQIPIFGWALKAGGFVTIDRENLSSARESFAQAVSRLRAGTSVLIFPEGTRSTVEHLLPFRRGGFLLAIKSGLPIVPVGIGGSREVRGKRSLVIRPGTIWVHYGEPIEASEYAVSQKQELMDQVREQIEVQMSRGGGGGAEVRVDEMTEGADGHGE